MTDPVTRLNAALEGRYRIERQLGEGGMATVYLADDLRHERKVALKGRAASDMDGFSGAAWWPEVICVQPHDETYRGIRS